MFLDEKQQQSPFLYSISTDVQYWPIFNIGRCSMVDIQYWTDGRLFSVSFPEDVIPKMIQSLDPTLREKCPNTEFLLVRIFPHLDVSSYFCVFSPNAGKYGPEKTSYLDSFHTVQIKPMAMISSVLFTCLKYLALQFTSL